MQDLVQNRKVFMVVNDWGVAFLSYRYQLNAGVPMVGGGFDFGFYNQKGNESAIPAFVYLFLPECLQYNTPVKLAKSLGAITMATIAVTSQAPGRRPRSSSSMRPSRSG